MGYTTKFSGKIHITPPLSEEEMGVLAEHYSEDSWPFSPERPQRSYCQWVPSDYGAGIQWDGGEKFYDSMQWMEYLIGQFFGHSHLCNGEILAQGEEMGDVWKLVVVNNEVSRKDLLETSPEPKNMAALPPAERAALALLATETEKRLHELVAKAKEITAITNADGRTEAYTRLRELVKSRTGITKTGKEARDDANKFSTAVIAEEKRLIAIAAPEEKRLQKMVDDFDSAEQKREEERIAGIQRRIQAFNIQPPRNATAAEIKQHLEGQRAVAIDDSFAEFKADAEAAKQRAVGELLLMHNDAVRAEKAEEDRKAEAERLRIQQEEQAAAQKKLDDERAELERQKKELADQAAKLAADQKALEEASKPASVTESQTTVAAVIVINSEGETSFRNGKMEEIDIDGNFLGDVMPMPSVSDCSSISTALYAGKICEPEHAYPLGDVMPPDIESPEPDHFADNRNMVEQRIESAITGEIQLFTDDAQMIEPPRITPEQEAADRDLIRHGIKAAIGFMPFRDRLHTQVGKDMSDMIVDYLQSHLESLGDGK